MLYVIKVYLICTTGFKWIYVLIGYAQVSTVCKSTDMQADALKKAGCQKIYTEKKLLKFQKYLTIKNIVDVQYLIK